MICPWQNGWNYQESYQLKLFPILMAKVLWNYTRFVENVRLWLAEIANSDSSIKPCKVVKLNRSMEKILSRHFWIPGWSSSTIPNLKLRNTCESSFMTHNLWVINHESLFVIFHFRAWLLERNVIIKATKEYNGNKYRDRDLKMRRCFGD